MLIPFSRRSGNPELIFESEAGMICPKCGTENADGSRFCKTCGAPLADGTSTAGTAVPTYSNKSSKKALMAVIAVVAVVLVAVLAANLLGLCTLGLLQARGRRLLEGRLRLTLPW